ncbi:MAG: nitroreductase family protein [Muribaculaceae bacterium]|nr:nitroreductase family protein [Muribaculaceae bacterium]
MQDVSAASEKILLDAHALGLGAVWTCLYPYNDRMEAATSLLNLLDGIVPFCLIPVGYPAKEHASIDKWHAERVHINGY